MKQILALILFAIQLNAVVILERADKKNTVTNNNEQCGEGQLKNPHMLEGMIYPSRPRAHISADFVGKSPQAIFTEIYKENFWLGTESLAGQGSSLASTRTICNELAQLMDNVKIESILDAGCGDCYWMQTCNIKHRTYIGIDIVPAMIEKNRLNFADEHHHFLCLNVANDPLPKVDMILCRDVLAHCDYKTACDMLRNFKATGSTFLLVTTHVGQRDNHNINVGDHCPYNLMKAPFNLPKPLLLIEETSAETPALQDKKAMGLWLLQDLDVSCLEY